MERHKHRHAALGAGDGHVLGPLAVGSTRTCTPMARALADSIAAPVVASAQAFAVGAAAESIAFDKTPAFRCGHAIDGSTGAAVFSGAASPVHPPEGAGAPSLLCAAGAWFWSSSACKALAIWAEACSLDVRGCSVAARAAGRVPLRHPPHLASQRSGGLGRGTFRGLSIKGLGGFFGLGLGLRFGLGSVGALVGLGLGFDGLGVDAVVFFQVLDA